MAAGIFIAIGAALAMLLLGRQLGIVLSSPETRAFTRLVIAHRKQGPLAQAESVGSIFSLYGLDASGRRDTSGTEVSARRKKLLKDAEAFDQRYGKYHGGVSARVILEQEVGKRLDDL